MEEEKLIEQTPISEEEFEEKIHDVASYNKNKIYEDLSNGILHLISYNGVYKFKSIKRAIRRGHISIFGDIYPRRPFNNRKRNKKGDITYQRRKIYEQFR